MSKRKVPETSSVPSVSYCWLVAKMPLGDSLKGLKAGASTDVSCSDSLQVVGRLELLVAGMYGLPVLASSIG